MGKKKIKKNNGMDIAERKEKLLNFEQEEERQKRELFARALRDLEIKTAKLGKEEALDTKFTKDKYRTMMKNVDGNVDKMRDMSRFLEIVYMPYKRLLEHFANLPLFYWCLTPQIDVTKVNPDKTLKGYYKTLRLIDKMNLSYEMRKVLKITLRDGVYFGYIYEDKNSFFIHQLPTQYCRIRRITAGCFDFHFDLSYFDKNKEKLPWYAEEFQTAYRLYESDKKAYRYQILNPAKSICIKSDAERLGEDFPAFLGLFEPLLDALDSRALQKQKDKLDIYKLLAMELPITKDSGDIDQFALKLETAMSFYNMLAEILPEYVGLTVSPMPIKSVEFRNDRDDKGDVHATSVRSIFDESGVSQSLFNTRDMNSDGLQASILTDAAFVWKIVESIEMWVKRYIFFNTKNSENYSFDILRVDIFNQNEAAKSELALANSGVPNKLRLAATAGLNPLTVISNQLFENEILQIHTKWKPLQTSYTMSQKSEVAETENKIEPEPIIEEVEGGDANE